jgi:hypothetical protein
MFDVWKPERAIEGLYIWLPIEMRDGQPVVQWRDRWSISQLK